MSDKEPSAATDSDEETKLFHERYLAAVNNPFRRRILEALSKGSLTFEGLCAETGLSQESLGWHLSLLESVRCVQTEQVAESLVYKLTQEGKVIDYLK